LLLARLGLNQVRSNQNHVNLVELSNS